MECFTGIAASCGVVGSTAFDYNRENFMYDRRLRFKKELKLMEFRIKQASLWREDVRDLISLTEYKMHAYLLVNVLMLGFTVVLWCEGRLPAETPQWLMMGSSLSITGAFMFLLLSMWLAMHAAVAAQSYEARLLTQLVRLPIPSWQEIEACRTYASEFEQSEGKQMFRVPFAMRAQERLVEADSTASPEPSPQAPSPTSPEAAASAAGTEASSSGETPHTGIPADPWGLERRGDDIFELGSHHGSEVAKLRHVKLAHQAMVYWQSYDAFSRISLSVGVNQLLLAMIYYMLGYILVQAGCRTAASYGVVLLIVLAEALAKLDMSLSLWQLRAIQVLLAFGPLMSCVAAYHWSLANFESVKLAETLVITAFVSNALLVGLIIRFCTIKAQDNGTMLPTAFRSVLYLDVFGWLKQGAVEGDLGSPLPRRNVSGRVPAGIAARRQLSPLGQHPERGTAQSQRPALASVCYNNEGKPMPMRPEDQRPEGHTQDMRDVPGMPSESGTAQSFSSTRFFNAACWMPGDPRLENPEFENIQDDDDVASIVTGHEHEVPRILPWRVFCTFAVALAIAWLLAAFYHVLTVSETWDLDTPFSVQGEFNESRHKTVSAVADEAVRDEDFSESRREPRQRLFLQPSLLALGSQIISGRGPSNVGSLGLRPQRVAVSWPHPNVEPTSLSCDNSGTHFVVTDGLTMFTARLGQLGAEARDTSRNGSPLSPGLNFVETDCDSLVGEGMQDTAVACGDRPGAGCHALVLHRQGRRLVACSIGEDGSGTSAPQIVGADGLANVSTAWLERLRDAECPRSGCAVDLWEPAGPHSRTELPVALATGLPCQGDGSEDCAVVGTTHGRVVQMRQHSRRSELIPGSVLRDSSKMANSKLPALAPGAVRMFGSRYLGILQEEGKGQTIAIMDGVHSSPSGRLRLPSWAGRISAFCAGGGHLYVLSRGASPHMWRAPMPDLLTATM